MTILHKTYHALIGVAIGLLGLWLFAGCIVPQAQAQTVDHSWSADGFTVTVTLQATEDVGNIGVYGSGVTAKGGSSCNGSTDFIVRYDEDSPYTITRCQNADAGKTFNAIVAFIPIEGGLCGEAPDRNLRPGCYESEYDLVKIPALVQGTPQPLPGIDPPQYLRAAPGDGEATLTWDAPFYDPGDITGYAYRYKEGTTYTDIPESGPGEENARSYTVTGLTNGTEYKFEVRAENGNRDGTPASVKATPEISVSSESDELPTSMQLYQNYPNPFNPATTITYRLDQASTVKVILYDLRGQEIANIFSGHRLAGEHSVHFEPHGLPSGTYVYRLVADAGSLVRTMTLIK